MLVPVFILYAESGVLSSSTTDHYTTDEVTDLVISATKTLITPLSTRSSWLT